MVIVRLDAASVAQPGRDGGEAWPAYLDRAHACLSTILDRPGGRIDSETATAAFTLLVGVRTLGVLKVDLEPTGITRLTTARERPNVPVTNTRWALAVRGQVMTAVEEYLTGALIAGFVVAALFVVRVAQALHRHYREAFEIASDLLPDSRTTVRASSPAAAEARPQSPVDAGDPRHPASTGSTRKAAS